jgi:hypothetical protein
MKPLLQLCARLPEEPCAEQVRTLLPRVPQSLLAPLRRCLDHGETDRRPSDAGGAPVPNILGVLLFPLEYTRENLAFGGNPIFYERF